MGLPWCQTSPFECSVALQSQGVWSARSLGGLKVRVLGHVQLVSGAIHNQNGSICGFALVRRKSGLSL